MNLKWARPAVSDLVEIRAFIAEENAGAAARMGRHIRVTARLLVTTTHLGHPGRIPETRELVVPRALYVLVYRVRRGQVEVLRVLHASRRPLRSLQ